MKGFNENLDFLLKNFLVHHQKENIKIEKFNSDSTLVEEGQEMDCLIIIVSGKAKIVQNYENGKRLLIHFAKPISILGDVEYIIKSCTTCTVIATETVLCFRIKYSEIEKLYKDNITFNNFLLDHLAKKLLNSSTRNSLNIIYPVKTRLASYLLSTIDDKGKTTISSMGDLSDYLGTSYRHLNRSLNELAAQGFIEKKQKKISVLQEKMLIEIARGNIYEDNKFD